ncbi:MAG: hypothetical protein U5L76_02215 [Patescibacteria group bacterium]|nr:hypothetical protein [Patescibacteria group bacterium]
MTKKAIIVITMAGKNKEEKQMNEMFKKEVIDKIEDQGHSVYFCAQADQLEGALTKDGDKVAAVMVLCLPGQESMNTNLLNYSLLKREFKNKPFFRCQLAGGRVLYGILRREGNYFFEAPRKTPAEKFHAHLLLAV